MGEENAERSDMTESGKEHRRAIGREWGEWLVEVEGVVRNSRRDRPVVERSRVSLPKGGNAGRTREIAGDRGR